MKKIILALIITLAPSAAAIYLLLSAPYIVTCIPNGTYHNLFGILTYFIIGGGIAAILSIFLIGIIISMIIL